MNRVGTPQGVLADQLVHATVDVVVNWNAVEPRPVLAKSLLGLVQQCAALGLLSALSRSPPILENHLRGGTTGDRNRSHCADGGALVADNGRHNEPSVSGMAQALFLRRGAAPLPLAQEVDKILNLHQLVGG